MDAAVILAVGFVAVAGVYYVLKQRQQTSSAIAAAAAAAASGPPPGYVAPSPAQSFELWARGAGSIAAL